MAVVRHADADSFLAAAAPVIARSAASEAFVTAWALGYKRKPPPADERQYLATAAQDGAVALAMQSVGGPVVIEDSDPAAAAEIADDLAGDWPALSGVVGSLTACEAFARRWRERTGRVHALRLHLRHHMLTAVADVADPGGAMRAASPDDIDWLIESQLAFIDEVDVPDDPARVRRVVPQRLADDRFRLWEHGGIVAYAGWTDAGPTAARVAPVYTPPAFRKRGYATALVAGLSRELLTRGKARLFLVTDAANPTSNAIYARVGYRPLVDFYHFDLVAPS